MMELIRATRIPAMGATCAAKIRAKCADPLTARGFALLLDQAVSSGTNFLTTIIIGRACLPQELGRYTLGFSLAMLLLRVPRALVWTPFTTFTPAMADDERRLYSGSMLIHQGLLGLAMALAISAAGVGMLPLGKGGGISRVLIVLGPAMALMLFREHTRRVCFARLRVGEALLVDVAVGTLQIAGMLLLAFSGSLTAARAYLVIAMASAPVMVAWVCMNRHSMEIRRNRLMVDFRRSWDFARWLLVGAVLVGFSAALDPWALSLMHGTTAVGIYAAAVSIIALTNPLVQGFHNFFGPHSAHVYASEGLRGLSRNITTATLAIGGMAGVFTLGVMIWGEDLLVLLYGAEYLGQGYVVTALVMPELVELVTLPTVFGLITLGRSDLVLKSNFIQLALAMTVGLLCIYQFGPAGVGYGALGSSLGSGVWKWFAFWSLAKND